MGVSWPLALGCASRLDNWLQVFGSVKCPGWLVGSTSGIYLLKCDAIILAALVLCFYAQPQQSWAHSQIPLLSDKSWACVCVLHSN